MFSLKLLQISCSVVLNALTYKKIGYFPKPGLCSFTHSAIAKFQGSSNKHTKSTYKDNHLFAYDN
jgi:hypothetical protein